MPDPCCCHHGNIFKAPDIDGDGICEVGLYFSSCASRFKCMHLCRLKNKRWECIGIAQFDIMTRDPSKVRWDGRVLRIAKNRYRFHNYYEGKKYWDIILLQ